MKLQEAICKKYGVNYSPSPLDFKVGISMNVKDGVLPVHGLRHPVEGDTSGWYIWAGDYSTDPDFFKPLHLIHMEEWCPWIIKYLGLPPGWRFLVTPDYEDIWEDKSLLDIS